MFLRDEFWQVVRLIWNADYVAWAKTLEAAQHVVFWMSGDAAQWAEQGTGEPAVVMKVHFIL